MMRVTAHHSVQELQRMMRLSRYGSIKIRIRAVILAMQGESAPKIADEVGRSRRSIQVWIKRYNTAGVDGLLDQPRPGAPTKLPIENTDAFLERINQKRQSHANRRITGRQIQEILSEEFGVKYSLGGVYDLLNRLGYDHRGRLKNEGKRRA